MSPQALRAESPDPRDDLFSLGVLVYFMLAGKTPTVNCQPISRVRPEISRSWDKFISRCLAEERDARFSNAADAKKALPKLKRDRPRWARAVTTAAALLVAGAAGIGIWRYAVPEKIQDRPALASQAITFEPIADRPVNAPALPLAANASSGLPVSYSVVSGPARVVDGTLVLTGPGTVVVRATQPGDAAFLPAPVVERTFKVNEAPAPVLQKSQSIVFEPIADRTIGDLPLDVFASSSSGLPVTVSVASGPATLTGSSRVTLTGPGTVTLRCEQPGDAAFLPAQSVERTFKVEDAVPTQLSITLPDGGKIRFVRIPPGSMMLGSPETEIGHRNDEPVHEFTCQEGFLLATTEVTQAQYLALIGARPSFHRKDWQNRPVEQVRFIDIVGGPGASLPGGFLGRLNALLQENGVAKWEAVLPSEDEWEYACRAGLNSPLNNNTALVSTVRDANASAVAVYGRLETFPVGSLLPNAWGLYDMHGNVAEWTREGTLRGGSFRDEAAACRAASRLRGQAGNSTPDRRFGFRIMLRLAKQKGS